jgi:hypothetical protein
MQSVSLRAAIACSLATATAAVPLSARADTPDGEAAIEARRFETLLEVGARGERAGRMSGAWSLIGTGAGAVVVAPFMLNSDDDGVREAGWWTLGLGGLTAGLGGIMLAGTGSLEDLAAAWRSDPAPVEERLARFERELADMAESAGETRVIAGVVTTVLSAGLLGWGLFEAARDDTWDGGEVSLAITGGFGVGVGLYAALAGETPAESMHDAWTRGKAPASAGLSLSPSIGLGRNGGFLGLAGGF